MRAPPVAGSNWKSWAESLKRFLDAQSKAIGHFLCTSDQSCALANTAYVAALDTTRVAEGMGVSSNQITVTTRGLYKISAMVHAKSTAADTVNIWLSRNGTDESAGVTTTLTANAIAAIPLVWTTELLAGDYLELEYAGSTTNVTLEHTVASAFCPASPSVSIYVERLR